MRKRKTDKVVRAGQEACDNLVIYTYIKNFTILRKS